MCLSKNWNADVVQISSEISQIDIATSVSVKVDVGILANDSSCWVNRRESYLLARSLALILPHLLWLPACYRTRLMILRTAY